MVYRNLQCALLLSIQGLQPFMVQYVSICSTNDVLKRLENDFEVLLLYLTTYKMLKNLVFREVKSLVGFSDHRLKDPLR